VDLSQSSLLRDLTLRYAHAPSYPFNIPERFDSAKLFDVAHGTLTTLNSPRLLQFTLYVDWECSSTSSIVDPSQDRSGYLTQSLLRLDNHLSDLNSQCPALRRIDVFITLYHTYPCIPGQGRTSGCATWDEMSAGSSDESARTKMREWFPLLAPWVDDDRLRARFTDSRSGKREGRPPV